MLKKTAVVTGATGFIGSNLACRLIDEGWSVYIIVRSHSSLSLLESIKDKLQIFCHDGTTHSLNAFFETAKPSIVFHLASFFTVNHKTDEIEPMIRSNIIFGTQLVEAMTANGVNCLINTGTSWQHYENQDYNPVCLYAATKQAYEQILAYYLEASPLRCVTLKLFDTYGPNDPRNKLFALLRKSVRNGTPLEMSAGEQRIDLVYIEDVVNAYLVAAEHFFHGRVTSETYAVSSGSLFRLIDVVKIYEKLVGQPLPVLWGSRPYRSREVMTPWSKGILLPGWQPQVTLEEGIKKMLAEG